METRWSTKQVADWQDRAGWLFGCNFTPSTAGNQIEIWSADSFDVETIERELGWARDLGMNVVRVYLHDLLWGDDSAGRITRSGSGTTSDARCPPIDSPRRYRSRCATRGPWPE
jgi:hypothetical protein